MQPANDNTDKTLNTFAFFAAVAVMLGIGIGFSAVGLFGVLLLFRSHDAGNIVLGAIASLGLFVGADMIKVAVMRLYDWATGKHDVNK